MLSTKHGHFSGLTHLQPSCARPNLVGMKKSSWMSINGAHNCWVSAPMESDVPTFLIYGNGVLFGIWRVGPMWLSDVEFFPCIKRSLIQAFRI